MRILLGGGTQAQLGRIVAKARQPGYTLDTVASDEEAGAWKRKARHADVCIVRTEWVSHKAWRQVRQWCPVLIQIPQKGEEAMLDAIRRVQSGLMLTTFVDTEYDLSFAEEEAYAQE